MKQLSQIETTVEGFIENQIPFSARVDVEKEVELHPKQNSETC
jgi:hypothetical protein